MIRGFFIFLVFIFKPSIWSMIKKRHPRLAKVMASVVCCCCCCCSTSLFSVSLSRTTDLEPQNDAASRLNDTRVIRQRLLLGQESTEEKIEVASTTV